jgi:poly(A) polymerase/tRNA nucleotidyltransferase (CCA-adding enzyme)
VNPFEPDAALAAVWDALPSARIVGGAVRDTLAGRPVADIDLATPLPPNAVTAALVGAGLKAVPTGLSHGTVTAVADGRGFEVTTLRRDVATDGRHAVVAFTGDWREDAARRDFTFNAMSMARDGAVFDYFDGRADLAAGRVRFVGPAAARIAEDYLRVLRFFRFYARYAAGAPDPVTEAALAAGVPGLARLSVERVWSELRLILSVGDPSASVALMRRLGVWQAAVPELAGHADLSALPADPVLRAAALLTGDAAALAERLKWSNADRDRLLRLLGTPRLGAGTAEAALRRLLAEHARDDLLGRAWLDGAGAAVRRQLEAAPVPAFALEGRDVLALGVPPGHAVGALLRAVRAWWLEGGCRADRDACLAELARRAVPPKIGERGE